MCSREEINEKNVDRFIKVEPNPLKHLKSCSEALKTLQEAIEKEKELHEEKSFAISSAVNQFMLFVDDYTKLEEKKK